MNRILNVYIIVPANEFDTSLEELLINNFLSQAIQTVFTFLKPPWKMMRIYLLGNVSLNKLNFHIEIRRYLKVVYMSRLDINYSKYILLNILGKSQNIPIEFHNNCGTA